jgi:hypothetical protein
VLFQSPLPLQKTETVMRYDSVKTKPVITSPVSSYCTDKPPTVSAKLWSHYKLFEASIYCIIYTFIVLNDFKVPKNFQ